MRCHSVGIQNHKASAKDLGIGLTAGASRCASSLNERIAKGGARAEGVGHLVKFNNEAAKLYATGVVPQQEYDINVVGASRGQMLALRRTAVKCLRRAGVRPCPTTLIRWRVNRMVDPAVRVPIQQIKLWAELYENMSEDLTKTDDVLALCVERLGYRRKIDQSN